MRIHKHIVQNKKNTSAQALLQITRIYTIWIIRPPVKSLGRGGKSVVTFLSESPLTVSGVWSSLSSTTKEQEILTTGRSLTSPTPGWVLETWYLKCMRINSSTLPKIGTNLCLKILQKAKKQCRATQGSDLSAASEGAHLSLPISLFRESAQSTKCFWRGIVFHWICAEKSAIGPWNGNKPEGTWFCQLLRSTLFQSERILVSDLRYYVKQ